MALILLNGPTAQEERCWGSIRLCLACKVNFVLGWVDRSHVVFVGSSALPLRILEHTAEDTDILWPQAHHCSNSAPLLSLQHARSEILPKHLKVTTRQSPVYVVRIPRLQDKEQALEVGHWQVGAFLSDA